MRVVRSALPGLFAAMLGGCGLITAPTEGGKLSAARILWRDAALSDYRYEVRSVCECLKGGRWIAVTIIGGEVRSGTYLDTEAAVEAEFLQALPTVPALFDRIQHAIEESAVLLEVVYDAGDGHPALINVDVSRAVADEEFSLQSRNLTAVRSGPTSRESR